MFIIREGKIKKISIILALIIVLAFALYFLFIYFSSRLYFKTLFKKATSRPGEISLNFVGDIMLSREVSARINSHGTDYPFLMTKDLLSDSDLTIANLESPFTSGQSDTNVNSMIFGAEKKSVEGLNFAGIDAVSLANNHFGNQGQNGMNLTFNWLKSHNIDYFGAGRNFTEAHQALIKQIRVQNIAFLGYTDSSLIPSTDIATESRAGVAAMDIEQVKKDIANIGQKADIIVVSMHAGTEYTLQPTKKQIDFAHAAIDAGANLVVGHHPHVVQPVENYKSKTIFYSLGNFIFDQAWSEETKRGMMANVIFDLDGNIKTKFFPVKIENMCQPKVLPETSIEYQQILNRLK